jgi:RNA polymerase sigma factor (sigma-70 family)
MTGKNDDAARTREDSFLAELIPQVAEHLAEQHAGDFDAEAGQARFLTWLTAHTKEPATPAKSRAGTGYARPTGSGRARTVPGNDPPAAALVSRATAGDPDAWEEMVERYSPLIWAICRRYGLDSAEADDVGQTVWLRLVDLLASLGDPAALPGWLATTTRRECLRMLRGRGSERPDARLAGSPPSADDVVIEEERHAALRTAIAELSPRCQQLLSMLASDPPRSYDEISAELGIPVRSIAAQRAHCLDRLRRHLAVAALVNTEAEQPERHDSIEASYFDLKKSPGG